MTAQHDARRVTNGLSGKFQEPQWGHCRVMPSSRSVVTEWSVNVASPSGPRTASPRRCARIAGGARGPACSGSSWPLSPPGSASLCASRACFRQYIESESKSVRACLPHPDGHWQRARKIPWPQEPRRLRHFASSPHTCRPHPPSGRLRQPFRQPLEAPRSRPLHQPGGHLW